MQNQNLIKLIHHGKTRATKCYELQVGFLSFEGGKGENL